MYVSLQDYGYTLIFKPTFKNKDGKVKGNCDADLVLQSMIDFDKYEKAIIVSGDGDFYSLVKYLREKNKLLKLLVPNTNYSGLLKKSAGVNISLISDLQNKLEYIKSIK